MCIQEHGTSVLLVLLSTEHLACHGSTAGWSAKAALHLELHETLSEGPGRRRIEDFLDEYMYAESCIRSYLPSSDQLDAMRARYASPNVPMTAADPVSVPRLKTSH